VISCVNNAMAKEISKETDQDYGYLGMRCYSRDSFLYLVALLESNTC